MTEDLINRATLLAHLRKSRDEYAHEHFVFDPSTGTSESSRAKEEYLQYLDENIEFIEQFPAHARFKPHKSGDPCPSCGKIFQDGDTCSRGGCPLRGDI